MTENAVSVHNILAKYESNWAPFYQHSALILCPNQAKFYSNTSIPLRTCSTKTGKGFEDRPQCNIQFTNVADQIWWTIFYTQ